MDFFKTPLPSRMAVSHHQEQHFMMSNLNTSQMEWSGMRTRTRTRTKDDSSKHRVVVHNSSSVTCFSGHQMSQTSSSPVASSSSSSSSAVPSAAGFGWCALCGDGDGWMSCGRCMGEGGFSTRPGLAGIKGKVGWACCKLCYGCKFLPCLFCGGSKSKDRKDCKTPLPPPKL